MINLQVINLMIYCLKTLFKEGINNGGDVTIYCSNSESVTAHSFVLENCSELFADMKKSDEMIKWDLPDVKIHHVKTAIMLMYVKNDINEFANTNINTWLNNLIAYFDFIEYIQPTNSFNKAIEYIVKRYSSFLFNYIHHASFSYKYPECKIRTDNDKNRCILEILIAIKNNTNKYITTIRNNLYKRYQTEISALSSIRNLCMQCQDADLFFIAEEKKIETANTDTDTNTKPQSAYVTFVKAQLVIAKQENPQLKPIEYMTIIAKKWATAPENPHNKK